MSLRAKWEFEYTASALAKAAEEQLAFRESRVTFWKAQQAEVIKKIKESGIEVHEDINEHSTMAAQYKAWQQVLAGNPESRVKLDHDDWMFFFGK